MLSFLGSENINLKLEIESHRKQPETNLTPVEPQSHFGDKSLKIQVVCPQNGTTVLKGLNKKLSPRKTSR